METPKERGEGAERAGGVKGNEWWLQCEWDIKWTDPGSTKLASLMGLCPPLDWESEGEGKMSEGGIWFCWFCEAKD